MFSLREDSAEIEDLAGYLNSGTTRTQSMYAIFSVFAPIFPTSEGHA